MLLDWLTFATIYYTYMLYTISWIALFSKRSKWLDRFGIGKSLAERRMCSRVVEGHSPIGQHDSESPNFNGHSS